MWRKIKRTTGVADQRGGRLWGKIAKTIRAAARSGGGDPSGNLTLRYAIDKAKEALMPADTIEKAILKGTGELGAGAMHEVQYEGYGPGGVAIIVEALTDNVTRTAPEVKKIFERGGGKLGATNCVSWNFTKRGVFAVNATDASEEKLMEVALDAGAEDIINDGETLEVRCEPAAYESVKKALADHKVPTQSAEITMIPGSTVTVGGDEAEKVLKLIEAFEEHDDVQNVYSNYDISDEVMAQMETA
jgi:YebC/PmpR family DNA-binding regulatory protein